jgi:hypothetical protein
MLYVIPVYMLMVSTVSHFVNIQSYFGTDTAAPSGSDLNGMLWRIHAIRSIDV